MSTSYSSQKPKYVLRHFPQSMKCVTQKCARSNTAQIDKHVGRRGLSRHLGQQLEGHVDRISSGGDQENVLAASRTV